MDLLTTATLKELLHEAVEATKAAGRYLLRRFGSSSGGTYCDTHDLKLEEDVRAEEIVRIYLSDRTDFAFIGEESPPPSNYEGLVWVVDPLDGTANYMRGIPHFATSVALIDNGVPVAGVIKNHCTGETFTAIAGDGAYCGGVPIRVSRVRSLKRAILAGGFMKSDEMVARNLELMQKSVKKTFKVRVTGSAALDLCDLARGHFDIYSEHGIRIWDIAAGILLAREAGAVVSVKHIGNMAYDVSALNRGLSEEYIKEINNAGLFRDELPPLLT